jgi:hypothetical protein
MNWEREKGGREGRRVEGEERVGERRGTALAHGFPRDPTCPLEVLTEVTIYQYEESGKGEGEGEK